jgi:probable HAF family extracellular repeat protein
MIDAFLIDGDDKIPILHPGGEWVTAYGLNDHGQVVGSFKKSSQDYEHAFTWDKATGWKNIEPQSMFSSRATDINNYGQISADFQGSAVRMEPNGLIAQIGTLGSSNSRSTAINSSGHVVGMSPVDSLGWEQNSFLWKDGAIRNLNASDGVSGRQEYDWAYDISDAGLVVGYVSLGGRSRLGYLYDSNSDAITYFPEVTMYSINNRGTVVGEKYDPASPLSYRATIYQNGQLYDLNDFISHPTSVYLGGAIDVNDTGQILAVGQSNFPGVYGFILTPIPEPSTLLFGMSMSVALAVRRKS